MRIANCIVEGIQTTDYASETTDIKGKTIDAFMEANEDAMNEAADTGTKVRGETLKMMAALMRPMVDNMICITMLGV